MEPLPHIKQDPENVDTGVAVCIWIASILIAAVAWLAFEMGFVGVAVALGVVAAVGVSLPVMPYSRWRALLKDKGNRA